MAVREGTYNSLLQGVSQQIPQERADGQLGAQLNMLSDAVTGLRRRSGFKYHDRIGGYSPQSYMEMVEILGERYVVIIDPYQAICCTYKFSDGSTSLDYNEYYRASSKQAIRTTVAHNRCYIVNTEKVPTKTTLNPLVISDNPIHYGYAVILSSSFSRTFYITLRSTFLNLNWTFWVTTSGNVAAQATPQYVAEKFMEEFQTVPEVIDHIEVIRNQNVLSFVIKDIANNDAQLIVESSSAELYIVTSNAARTANRTNLAANLSPRLDGFIMAVGNTGNSAYYEYQHPSRTWKEVAKFEYRYRIDNSPRYWHVDNASSITFDTLWIKPRASGDNDNNPEPKFIGYGITGIGAYQSRLVLLSGAYVHLSKTNEFDVFSRTTVTELLDDDPIEISSASLASAQFEYCIPYNKDLLLIAQGYQAVVPANTSVLTPKNAVVYPSATVDLSLAVKPQPAARTLYYTYQRGTEFYQVGELVPSSYTDAQYQAQNLTDHIPMYATGVCTGMAVSSTNNMVVFTSDSNEVLVNEYLWVGDDRPLMSFHKWVFPYKVIYASFVNDFLVLFFDTQGTGTFNDQIIIGTINTKTNQLDDKPAPYLDQYYYVECDGDKFTIPLMLQGYPVELLDVVIYDDRNLRHQSVEFSIREGTLGTEANCKYNGTVAIGYKFKSEFSLTPPFIKDENGKVVAGERSIIHSLKMTFKQTGQFNVQVKDTFGQSYDGSEDTALTWSEAALGYTWVNSVGTVTIPCRTRLSSTECTVTTEGTTDLNLVSLGYLVRIAQKHRRL